MIIPKSTFEIIKLYCNGKSTAEIAKILGRKKNTVIVILRYHNLLKKSNGTEFEDLVDNFFTSKGATVEKQRGDCYFDLLIDGNKVDVKSASKNEKSGKYSFDIWHDMSKTPNWTKIDYYILIFKNEKGFPMFKLEADLVKVIAITISSDPFTYKGKYPLEFLGYLKKGGEVRV